MRIGEEASGPEGTSPAVMMSERGTSGQDAGLAGTRFPDGFARFAGSIRLAGCAGVLAIVALSLVPVEWRPTIGLAKEIEHGIAYCLVAVVLTLAGLARWPRILVIVVLAAALEFGQAFVPGRDSSLIDFLASAAGALLGFGLCALVPSLVSRDGGWRLLDHPAPQSGPVHPRSIFAIVALGVLAVGASMAAAHGTAAGLARDWHLRCSRLPSWTRSILSFPIH